MISFFSKERVMTFWRQHGPGILKGAAVLGVFASLTVAGHQYVQSNVVEYYRVYMADQEVGTVQDPQVVEQYILSKYKKLEEANPDIHHVIDSEGISYMTERAFKARTADESTLRQLDRLITVRAVGVELVVDGQVMGVVRDKEKANEILDQVKQKYLPPKKKEPQVSILSAPPIESAPPGTTELVSDGFVQQVELKSRDIEPSELSDPDELVKKLLTGDVKPTIYTVEKGDCVSCIAKKFNIPRSMIYQNNPWIQDDRIKVGQQLDLTILQPTLAVKTLERVTENQEVQYDTVYQTDDSLRQGVTQTITPGKNGLKKVTYLLTKVNGLPVEEEMVDEQLLEEPVSAVAKKGTKVVLGEGTGKFSWPVVSPKISSSYGRRWGTMHKGIDITGKSSILAADNGVIIYAGNKGDGYGNKIIIDHKNGYQTVYGHLSKFNTSRGKIVEKGEKIGIMGDTGDSTGVHLHFEVHKNGVIENPIKYLSR